MTVTKKFAIEQAVGLLEDPNPKPLQELRAIAWLLLAPLVEGVEGEQPDSPPASSDDVAAMAARFLTEPTPDSFANLRDATASWLGGRR